MRGRSRRALPEANLAESDLTSAELNDTDLSNACVPGAVFKNACLQGARLRSLRGFERADWIGIDIHGVNFAGAYRFRRFVADQNYLKEFRDSSRQAEYLYWLWWATSDCGRSVSRWSLWILAQTLVFAWLYTFAGVDFGARETWLSPIYFSVVTFTTLGYGDVLPVTPLAQGLVIAQVVVGYVMLGGLLSIFSNILARRGE